MAATEKQQPSSKRHYFFLNPYIDIAFSRCPKCENATKLRKFPLVVHVEPHQLFILNMTCRYCPNCDLVIAKQQDLERLLKHVCQTQAPELEGHEYFVFGTADRSDWREGFKGQVPSSEFIDRVHVFKDVLKFEVITGGWHPTDGRNA